MIEDLEKSSGSYWKKYLSALKNPILVYHTSLSDLFLDEHIQQLVLRIFPEYSEGEVAARNLPDNIIHFAFGN